MMKFTLIASVLIHVGGLALVPSNEPQRPQSKSIAISASTGPVEATVAVSIRSPIAKVARYVRGCGPSRVAGRSGSVHTKRANRNGPELGL